MTNRAMTDYNKLLIAKSISWLVIILIMAIIFAPVLALMSITWFAHWPRWAIFLFNLFISLLAYISPNTQYLREETEIKIRRLLGIKY